MGALLYGKTVTVVSGVRKSEVMITVTALIWCKDTGSCSYMV